ncbi:MAG: hypothetical protein LUG46_02295, partial [Erysipelotrichaceae bacterium]|nr:hypothetical protein [Erysipelotrichaceae bacterium]
DIKAQTTIQNIFTNEVIILTDMNLGAFNQLKQSYLYLHIIHYHDIYIQSGLCMSFDQNEEVDQWLKSNEDTFMKPYDVNQLLLVENYYRINGSTKVALRRVTR